MNIAVLFEGMESVGTDYSDASFQTFCTHQDIDRIFLIRGCQVKGSADGMFEKEYGSKPVTVLHDMDTLSEFWLYVLQGEFEKPDFYIFYDIRGACVTEDKIGKVLALAKNKGVALCADESENWAFPAAVDSKHYILHHLKRFGNILNDLSEYAENC